MPQMITIRKTTNQTAHRAQQDGTWMGADLFTSTVCGLTIRSGEWSEVDTSGRGWSALVGHGPAFLLQPCMRCEAAVRKLRDADHAEALADMPPVPAQRPRRCTVHRAVLVPCLPSGELDCPSCPDVTPMDEEPMPVDVACARWRRLDTKFDTDPRSPLHHDSRCTAPAHQH
jgi:hypothetical protein